MSSPVYLDECVDIYVAPELTARGITARTAVAAGMLHRTDDEQLDHATANGWVIVTHDVHDFRRLHRRRIAEGRAHGGIITVPYCPVPILALRIAMVVDWIGTHGQRESTLASWASVQFRLTQGERIPGFSESDIRLALGMPDA